MKDKLFPFLMGLFLGLIVAFNYYVARDLAKQKKMNQEEDTYYLKLDSYELFRLEKVIKKEAENEMELSRYFLGIKNKKVIKENELWQIYLKIKETR